jgi:hypothetical protein
MVNGRDSVSDMLYLKMGDGRDRFGKGQEVACGSVVWLERAKGGLRTSIGKEVMLDSERCPVNQINRDEWCVPRYSRRMERV